MMRWSIDTIAAIALALAMFGVAISIIGLIG
jgi:hypothetical protein